MTISKIKSGYALLDVLGSGRHKLAKHFERRPALGPCPENLRIPVTIHGDLIGQASRDDGTSIEFSIAVEGIEVGRDGND